MRFLNIKIVKEEVVKLDFVQEKIGRDDVKE